jgi:hypothetical protein
MALRAMIAVLLLAETTLTAVRTAIMIIARTAPPIAVCATMPTAWVAQRNAQPVAIQSARTAWGHAQHVKNPSVLTVWNKVFARPAYKKRYKKMKKNNQKTVCSPIQQNREALSDRRPKYRNPAPLLRFSPTAWAKLLYFRDRSDNEVGGFGITEPDDLLYVREFITVKQEVSIVSVEFDDEAVADFFDTQVDLGRQPEQFGRVWLHSHPGDSPQPSDIDEETFACGL